MYCYIFKFMIALWGSLPVVGCPLTPFIGSGCSIRRQRAGDEMATFAWSPVGVAADGVDQWDPWQYWFEIKVNQQKY